MAVDLAALELKIGWQDVAKTSQEMSKMAETAKKTETAVVTATQHITKELALQTAAVRSSGAGSASTFVNINAALGMPNLKRAIVDIAAFNQALLNHRNEARLSELATIRQMGATSAYRRELNAVRIELDAVSRSESRLGSSRNSFGRALFGKVAGRGATTAAGAGIVGAVASGDFQTGLESGAFTGAGVAAFTGNIPLAATLAMVGVGSRLYREHAEAVGKVDAAQREAVESATELADAIALIRERSNFALAAGRSGTSELREELEAIKELLGGLTGSDAPGFIPLSTARRALGGDPSGEVTEERGLGKVVDGLSLVNDLTGKRYDLERRISGLVKEEVGRRKVISDELLRQKFMYEDFDRMLADDARAEAISDSFRSLRTRVDAPAAAADAILARTSGDTATTRNLDALAEEERLVNDLIAAWDGYRKTFGVQFENLAASTIGSLSSLIAQLREALAQKRSAETTAAVDSFNRSLDEEIRLLMLENDILQGSEEAADRTRIRFEKENAAKKAGIPLDEERLRLVIKLFEWNKKLAADQDAEEAGDAYLQGLRDEVYVLQQVEEEREAASRALELENALKEKSIILSTAEKTEAEELLLLLAQMGREGEKTQDVLSTESPRQVIRDLSRERESLTSEAATLGMTTDARDKYVAMKEIDVRVTSALIEANDAEAESLIRLENEWANLYEEARRAQSIRENADSLSASILRPFESLALGMGNARDLARTAWQEIQALTLRAAVFNPMEQALSAFLQNSGGFFGSLFGGGWGGGGGGGGGNTGGSGVVLEAMGGAYAGGSRVPVTGFSRGGVPSLSELGVVSQPTFFPFRGGVGVAGEAGDEAILPVTRNSKGRLSVDTSGSGPRTINNTTIKVYARDADSFRLSERQTVQRMKRYQRT